MGWNNSLIAESSKARLSTNKKSMFNMIIKNVISESNSNTNEEIDNNVKTKMTMGKINNPVFIP